MNANPRVKSSNQSGTSSNPRVTSPNSRVQGSLINKNPSKQP